MTYWNVGPKVDGDKYPHVAEMQKYAREMQDTMFPPFRPSWFRARKRWKAAYVANWLQVEAEGGGHISTARWQRKILRKAGVKA